MYVAVQHNIRDREGFWGKAQEIVPNLPDNLKLHHCFPTKNGSHGICVWEASSVQELRQYLDGQTAGLASNDYFEVENKDSVALPSALVTSAA